MRIYITDIGELDEAVKAVAWGASAVGLQIGYGKGFVHPEAAREIFMSIPMFVSRVGIFANEKKYHIQELVTFCRLDTLHFIGCEQPNDLARYSEHLIKNIPAKNLASGGNYPVQAIAVDFSPGEILVKSLLPSDKLLILSGNPTIEKWEVAVREFQPYAIQLSMPAVNRDLVAKLLML